MMRSEMIEKLKTIPFRLLWPEASWTDLGFTEREIWVNGKGYGFILLDEPTTCWSGKGIPKRTWKTIRKKLSDGTLTQKDIAETSLTELLDAMDVDAECGLCDVLSGLLSLQAIPEDCLYCLDTADGLRFFPSKEAFNEVYERDWCDRSWDELSDQELKEWSRRLLDTESR